MTEIDTSSSRKNVSLYHKEREKKVLELYHVQGKTTRDIQRELEMSPNTITDILKRDREEKEKEEKKEQTSVYNVGDDNGNGGNGDARARSRPTINSPQQQILQPEQQQQQAMIMPLPTTGLTTEVKSLSPNQKSCYCLQAVRPRKEACRRHFYVTHICRRSN